MATPLTDARRTWRMRAFIAAIAYAIAPTLFCAMLVWRNRHGKGV